MREAQTSVGHKSLGAATGLDSQHPQRTVRGACSQPEHRAVSPGLSHTAKRQQTEAGKLVPLGVSAARHCLFWVAAVTGTSVLDSSISKQKKPQKRAQEIRYLHKCCRATCASLDRQNICVSLI